MGENSGQESTKEPNLELPSLFGRRKKQRRSASETPDGHGKATGSKQPATSPTAPEAVQADEDRAGEDRAGGELVEPRQDDADAPTTELDRAALAAAADRPAEPAASRTSEPTSGPAAPAAPEPGAPATGHTTEPHERRAGGRRAARSSGPALPGAAAAVLTGLLVGLFGAGATYGGVQGCDALRGTSSCGGGPGLGLVVVILALMVLVGAGLLALFRVPEPRSTSFLGVGLTFVVVLVALMSAVFSAWMFFVAPVLSAAAYGASHWVTTRNVELPEPGPEHDVR